MNYTRWTMKLTSLLLAAALLACLPACHARRVTLNGVEMSIDEAARIELEAARDRARADEFAEAAAMFEAVAQRYPEAVEADEALFGAGEAWEAAGQPMKARAAYEQLLAHHPRSDKASAARQRVAALGGDQEAAIASARAKYEKIPEAERFEAARQLAQEAEAAGHGVAAFHWRIEVVERARTDEERAAARAALEQLIDGGLSTLDVGAIAQGLDDRSFAAPLVRAKQARLLQHLRQYEELEAALHDFVRRHPSEPFAIEAQALLERLAQRKLVEPTKIGVVLPLSGPYKLFGEQLLTGIKLAFAGSGLELVVRDDKGEGADAALVVEKLVYDDHVIAVIGGVLTAEAQAAALKAAELEVPLVAFSRTEGFTHLSPYVFRSMLTSSQMADSLVRYAMESRGMKRFAILHPSLAYGEELRDLFWEGVEARGGEIRGVESYAQDATHFAEPIKKLVGRYYVADRADYHKKLAELRAQEGLSGRQRRNAIERLRSGLTPVVDFEALLVPDQWKNVALVAPALAFEDVITNWCDTRDLERIEKTTGTKVQPVLLLGGNLWNHPELPARGGKYVNCSVFVDGFYAQSARPETVKFVSAFSRATGREPGLLEAYGYDAGLTVQLVLTKAKPPTRDALRTALAGVSGVPSAMGPTSVTADRELVHPLYFLTVDRGALREADPAKKDGPP